MIYTYLAHIPLPEELEERLDDYTKTLKNDYLNVLSVPRLTAHLTLMRMNCQADEEQHITDELNDISLEPVDLIPEAITKTSKSALALKMKDEDVLHDLHLAVAEAFAERQANPANHVKPEYQDRIETIQRYGSPFFGDHYDPHMTIGYTGDDLHDDIDADLPLPQDTGQSLTFTAKEIHLSKKEQNSGRPYETVGRYDIT